MDADALRDVLQRHAVEAVPGKQIFGGVEDLLGRSRRDCSALVTLTRRLLLAADKFRPFRSTVTGRTGDDSIPLTRRYIPILRRILSILPVDASGMLRTRITDSGIHQDATRPRNGSSSSSSLIAWPLRISTSRIGRSPHLGSGRPITAARETCGQRADDRLDLGRVDPFAARLDQVLGAPGDDEVAVGVDAGEIAGVEPAIAGGALSRARNSARPPLGRARADALRRRAVAAGAGLRCRPASGRPPPPAGRTAQPLATGSLGRRRRFPEGESSVMPQLVCTVTPADPRSAAIKAGGIGEPPTMIRLSDGSSPPVFLEMVASGRARRSGRRRRSSPLPLRSVGETGAVRLPTGQHELPARCRHRKGQAPGIGVEHRHDGQHGVRLA